MVVVAGTLNLTCAHLEIVCLFLFSGDKMKACSQLTLGHASQYLFGN